MPESCIVMRLAWLPSWALWLLIVCVSATSAYFGSRAFGWPIAWGSIADWAAACGAFVAALVALRIANHDRTLRAIEQEDERVATSKIQARLVKVKTSCNSGSPTVHVSVVNHGQLPVLDVDLQAATWLEHPEARWATNWRRSDPTLTIEPLAQIDLHHDILLPRSDQDDVSAAHSKTAHFYVCFAHPDRDEPIHELVPHPPRADGLVPPTHYQQLDISLVIITVHFTTADGIRWQVIAQGGTGDAPVRVQPRSHADRWFTRVGLGR
ncbi:hypothetical protein ABQF31_28515 [Mycobacterium syngnathidarum]